MKVKLILNDYLVEKIQMYYMKKGDPKPADWNGPEFRDVFHELDSHEFILYDIISLNRRPLDGAIAQIDAVFVPRHSPLRSDKRWALSRL